MPSIATIVNELSSVAIGTDSLASVQAANRILARGVSYAPTDWRNRHYLGFNHFFYLGRNAEAADIMEPAIHLPRAPNYLARLVAKLKHERDGIETTRDFLVSLAENTEDPYAEAEYLKAIDEIDTATPTNRHCTCF